MENWYGAALCREARERSRGKEKQKLSAIHAGISALAALAVTVLYYLLEKGIAQTGGLSGMGMRSILQTIATLLSGANSVLAPFWNLGFWFVALLWANAQHARTSDLLTGFRRFGAYLRLLLNRCLLMIAAGLASIYASSFLYMMTPWSNKNMDFADATGMDMAAASDLLAQMDSVQLNEMLRAMVPMLVIWAVLLLILMVPMLYKFRMAEFCLLENRRMRPLQAMFRSAQLLRRRRFRLFLLDLRFWWYYGLHILCLLLYSADLWLPMLGISLPDGILTTMVLYVLYLLSLFLLQTFLRPQVQTAYALAYRQLSSPTPEAPQPEEAPANLPWNEQ